MLDSLQEVRSVLTHLEKEFDVLLIYGLEALDKGDYIMFQHCLNSALAMNNLFASFRSLMEVTGKICTRANEAQKGLLH